MMRYKLLGLLCLLSPFLIGWGIFSLLAPQNFWQAFATTLFVFFICGIEGMFAWVVGFALLAN